MTRTIPMDYPDAVNKNHFHRIFCGYWIAIAVNACYILRMESIQ
jgi:hypothetical protein